MHKFLHNFYLIFIYLFIFLQQSCISFNKKKEASIKIFNHAVFLRGSLNNNKKNLNKSVSLNYGLLRRVFLCAWIVKLMVGRLVRSILDKFNKKTIHFFCVWEKTFNPQTGDSRLLKHCINDGKSLNRFTFFCVYNSCKNFSSSSYCFIYVAWHCIVTNLIAIYEIRFRKIIQFDL